MSKRKHHVYKCRICGGPVSDNKAKGKGRCPTCYWNEFREAEKQRWIDINRNDPHYCVICGKQFEWTPTRAHCKVETCSRHCAGLLRTSRLKETPEHLTERLVAYIQTQGRYITLVEICRVYKFTEKYVRDRGLTIEGLNKLAGTYTDSPELTDQELEKVCLDLIKEHPHITNNELISKLGLHRKAYLKSSLRISKLRKSCGLSVNPKVPTREELELAKAALKEQIISWLKEQKFYCTGESICQHFGWSYCSTIYKYKLDVKEMNALAGHKKTGASYHEDQAYLIMQRNSLVIERQKSFPDCKNVFQLKYDFYLPDYNTLIEVDGEQHYNAKYDNFNRSIKNDQIKDRYALEHGIALHRIRIAPKATFIDRLQQLLDKIKGLPRVSEEVQTDSNCGDTQTDDAEGNPQPSHIVEGSTTIQ